MSTNQRTRAGNPATLESRSVIGLNGLNFFIADMLTGFGPFVSVYLATNGWSPAAIGVALSVGTIAAVAGQVPAGIVVDAVRNTRLVTAAGIAAIIISALMLGAFSARWSVFGGEILEGVSASLLTPAIATLTLAISHSEKLAERLGSNVRFKALGSMLAAFLMGYVGTHFGSGTVFYVAAVFGSLAVLCLLMISSVDIANAPHRTEHRSVLPKNGRTAPMCRPQEIWRDPRLLKFAACVFMFSFSNTPLLPFAVAGIERQGVTDTDMVVSIALIVSQAVAALISPRLGGFAQARGRKCILLVGFIALAIRCVLFTLYSGEIAVVVYQVLDGISAAAIGVMVPLIVSDLTHRGGRFNLAMGLIGLAMTSGATLSTTFIGFVTQHLGFQIAFSSLAMVAGVGCLFVAFVMPETGDAVEHRGVPSAKRA